MTTANAFTAALVEERTAATTALADALRTGDETARLDALDRLADLQDIACRSLDMPRLSAV